jgi:hypothetical protein
MNRAAILLGLSLAPAAHAQFVIDWYTVDGGGGTASSGTFSLTGTIGQPDAAVSAGGPFQCAGGFWGGAVAAQVCYANCDNSTTAPALNVLDFQCFLNRFAAADAYANCDGSTTAPVLNVLDFQCFLNRFAAGCS